MIQYECLHHSQWMKVVQGQQHDMSNAFEIPQLWRPQVLT